VVQVDVDTTFGPGRGPTVCELRGAVLHGCEDLESTAALVSAVTSPA
jgi:hypothetical protein